MNIMDLGMQFRTFTKPISLNYQFYTDSIPPMPKFALSRFLQFPLFPIFRINERGKIHTHKCSRDKRGLISRLFCIFFIRYLFCKSIILFFLNRFYACHNSYEKNAQKFLYNNDVPLICLIMQILSFSLQTF